MTWDVVRWSLVAVIGLVLLVAAISTGSEPVALLLGIGLLLLGVIQVSRNAGATRR